MKNKQIVSELKQDIKTMQVPDVLEDVTRLSNINTSSTYKPKRSSPLNIFKFRLVKIIGAPVLASMIILSMLLLPVLNMDQSFEESSYFISIDINPSIEMQVSSSGYVMGINPLNDTAQNIVSSRDLDNYLGKEYEVFLDAYIGFVVEDGILVIPDEAEYDEETFFDNVILFSVFSTRNDALAERSSQFEDRLEHILETRNIPAKRVYQNRTTLREGLSEDHPGYQGSLARLNYIINALEELDIELENGIDDLSDINLSDFFIVHNQDDIPDGKDLADEIRNRIMGKFPGAGIGPGN